MRLDCSMPSLAHICLSEKLAGSFTCHPMLVRHVCQVAHFQRQLVTVGCYYLQNSIGVVLEPETMLYKHPSPTLNYAPFFKKP